jgi:hypothetical protein
MDCHLRKEIKILVRNRLIVGTIFGLVAVCFVLAAEYEVIAFNEYRYHSPIITFLFAIANLPIIAVMSVTGAGYSLGTSMALFFVWWFVIGFVLTWILQNI